MKARTSATMSRMRCIVIDYDAGLGVKNRKFAIGLALESCCVFE